MADVCSSVRSWCRGVSWWCAVNINVEVCVLCFVFSCMWELLFCEDQWMCVLRRSMTTALASSDSAVEEAPVQNYDGMSDHPHPPLHIRMLRPQIVENGVKAHRGRPRNTPKAPSLLVSPLLRETSPFAWERPRRIATRQASSEGSGESLVFVPCRVSVRGGQK